MRNESMIQYYTEKVDYWMDDSQWNLEWHHTPSGRAWREENADYYRQRARSMAIRSGYADAQEAIRSTKSRKEVTL